MKNKTFTIIFGMILLVGILGMIGAEEDYIGVISNTTGIDIFNFIAGTTTTANFSFDYEDSYAADKHYPLVFKINISFSEEDCLLPSGDCSVLKGDFAINGIVKRYYFFGLYSKEIKLTCSEGNPLTINHQMGSNTVDVPNGIFYCYNTTEGTIQTLKKHNKVFLNIFSNPALYPATYKITAQMFYADDTTAPIINIINKADFEGERKYYRESDNIEVQATISDNMEISNKWGTIFLPNENITVPFSHKTDDTYYFTKILPIDIPEDDYELRIYARDNAGNTGNDSTTLRIDRTGPNITAIQPNGSIYKEIIPVELNVTDEKAGVNTESIYYRLREMNGTSICSEAGIGTWDCYNSGWVNIELDEISGLYETDINTTEIGIESGEYWLDIKAEDLLGNIGILE